MDQFIREGVMEEVRVRGARFVTEDSFLRWARSERLRGRPVKCEGLNPVQRLKFLTKAGQNFISEQPALSALQKKFGVKKKKS